MNAVLTGCNGRGSNLDVPVPCARCGQAPSVYQDGVYTYISCPDCYDGSEDSSTRTELATWYTRQRAVDEWNEKMEELAVNREVRP